MNLEAEEIKNEPSEPSETYPPVTIMWSGGYDSTAALLQYLGSKRDIRLVSVNLTNQPEQVAMEKAARSRILELLKARTEKFDERVSYVQQDWPMLNCGGCISLGQPPLWVYIASFCALPGDVVFAWVKHDDVWHNRRDVIDLEYALRPFTNTKNLLFPFEWDTKEQILKYYRGNEDIFHALSSCEDGKSWTTHDCPKCNELRSLCEKLRKL